MSGSYRRGLTLRRRVALAGAVAAIVATALLLGGVLRHGSPTQGRAAAPVAVAPDLQAGFAGGDTAAQIGGLQQTLRSNPRDAHSYDLLGLAYQQRARETGDPTYYTKSEGVLRRALRLDPNDLLATSGLGSLALSRHRFRDALALGRRARALSPWTARNYGVIGDALVELGRYDAAFTAFDRMSSLKPSVSSYARISYARELLGDFAGAASAMRLALDAAVGQPEALAWTHVQLGKLFWLHGRSASAAREAGAALAAFPGYVYAYDLLAQVEAARGHIRRAIALEGRAVDAIPLPQFVATLGDLYRVAGDRSAARKHYALIGAIERLLAANGVKTDLETALFDVDHAVRLPHALALARAAHADRPSIEGDDVVAWALARNGRCTEALPWSKRALRLGTRDATKYFHRGMIERCLGDNTAARTWFRRALALNPHFSLLWAPVARRYA
jgi:tetratricopeptide (TPR) repeat protein